MDHLSKKLSIVGFCGFFGAIFRILFFEILKSTMDSWWITLIINIIGSGLLGFLCNFTYTYRKEILSGFLGAFTTFATFEFDEVVMINQHVYLWVFTYLLFSLGFALGAFKLGQYIYKIQFTKEKTL